MVPYRSPPKKTQTNNNAKKQKNKSQKTKHTKQTPPQIWIFILIYYQNNTFFVDFETKERGEMTCLNMDMDLL